MLGNIPVDIPVYMSIYLIVYQTVYLPTCLPIYLPISLGQPGQLVSGGVEGSVKLAGGASSSAAIMALFRDEGALP